jgi:hypothetical protein
MVASKFAMTHFLSCEMVKTFAWGGPSRDRQRNEGLVGIDQGEVPRIRSMARKYLRTYATS